MAYKRPAAAMSAAGPHAPEVNTEAASVASKRPHTAAEGGPQQTGAQSAQPAAFGATPDPGPTVKRYCRVPVTRDGSLVYIGSFEVWQRRGNTQRMPGAANLPPIDTVRMLLSQLEQQASRDGTTVENDGGKESIPTERFMAANDTSRVSWRPSSWTGPKEGRWQMQSWEERWELLD